MPEALTLASVTGSGKRLRKLNVLRDWTICDLTLSGPAEDGISLYCAERVRIQDVGGRDLGVGTVVAQYCDGLTIEDCWLDGSVLTHASYGAAFSFAETRNTLLLRPRARHAGADQDRSRGACDGDRRQFRKHNSQCSGPVVGYAGFGRQRARSYQLDLARSDNHRVRGLPPD